MWLLPISLMVFTTILAIPMSRYMAWIMDSKYTPPRFLGWFEKRLDSGPQSWKQYAAALLTFNVALFIYGFIALAVQPIAPLNPRGLGMLSPTTIFNSVASFMTNTNLQHYSGDVHLSNWSQIFFVILNQYVSAAVGLCALTAIIRCFRAEKHVGNFFVDMWRVVVYMFVPVAFVIGILFMQQGMPMTYQASHQVSTLEPAAMGTADNGQPKQQTLIVGPVAAVIPIKMLGTNGGGFYGMNSAHPYENPSAGSNFVTTLAMMIFPFALVLMYGRMLGRLRHAVVIYSVMLSMMIGLIAWAVYWDALKPNPAFTAHPVARSYPLPGAHRTLTIAPLPGLPV